mmetsp:Transcript_1057/g.2890  ORF Transcript_1057/g.2890 Transcript_1057/m.2890 type:complete len:403 (-) Transcript_1057:1929-3137(-)
MSSPAARGTTEGDHALVFEYACRGELPEDVMAAGRAGQATPVAEYLAAARKLRLLRIASPGDAEAEAPDAQAPSGGRKRKHGGGSAAGLVMGEDAAVAAASALVRRFRFGMEHVGDSRLLKSAALWGAFFDAGALPTGALLRNLGRLTALGVVAQRAPATADVVCRLTSAGAVSAARLHPIGVLEAMRVYASGRGDRGSLVWAPVAAVTDALETAFELSFKSVEPTGKRYLLGVDVSGSMAFTRAAGMSSLSARDAASAIMMALMRAERGGHVSVMAFSHGFQKLNVDAGMRLTQLQHAMDGLPFSGTDCSQPMLYALRHRIPVDVFVVMTDNETYSGAVHPKEALARYRVGMGMPDAKLAVLAFSATEFSIADPDDPGMLDVAGLDSAVPRILNEFALGRL